MDRLLVNLKQHSMCPSGILAQGHKKQIWAGHDPLIPQVPYVSQQESKLERDSGLASPWSHLRGLRMWSIEQ